MIGRFVGAVLAAACAWPSAAATTGAPGDARGVPMTFEWRREGPADVCGSKCRTWISAVGTITANTPRHFEGFARENDVRGAVLVLDSGGGSVLGTLELGRIVRRLDMGTTVGRTTLMPAKDGEVRATLSPKADCESMCAFLLLAGTRRYVPPEANVLVHQIWLGDRRDDATAGSYSAEDIMVIQRDIGRLVLYTAEMGGGADLVEIALRIPPWERLRPLTAAELTRAKLQTAPSVFASAAPEPVASPPAAAPAAVSSASTAAAVAVAAITDRGWLLHEKASRSTLTRRHPLTVEGEEIGTFDLVFACGATPDSYTATYREARRPGPRGASVALKDVSLTLGRETSALKVMMSETTAKPAELISSARGKVSAALVKSLAGGATRSLMVETATNRNEETAIRVGNTGLDQHFAKFAAACAR
jgi:hypothetical protein